ncbi:MAG: sodium/substrate symporter small subunit [Pseudomonadota bacterium]|nr:sodium/substrate symporter small subunit [Pseudomonadota bacterium]
MGSVVAPSKAYFRPVHVRAADRRKRERKNDRHFRTGISESPGTLAANQASHGDPHRDLVLFLFRGALVRRGPQQNKFPGFPLGFYMAAQGALIVFVVQLFVFVWQQDRIDHACGQAEDA